MAYFLGFLYLAAYIAIYLSLMLLPYYVAYSIIEPHSFLGVVGVFILGSVIVPLTLWLAFLVFGSFFVAYDKFKSKIGHKTQISKLSYSNESSPLDVTPRPENKSSNAVLFFSILGIGAIGVILAFTFLYGAKKTEEAPYDEIVPYEESVDNYSADDNYNDTSNDEIGEQYLTKSTIADNYNYMNDAVEEFLEILADSGISGAARRVRDCYVNTKVDNLYCLYLDNTARLMNDAVSKQMGFHRDEYLEYDRVLARNQKYYYVPTNTSHLASNHQKSIETQLIQLLNIKMQEKNYKSGNESGVSTQSSDNNSYGSYLDVEMSQNFNKNTNDAPEQLEPEFIENKGETTTVEQEISEEL